MNEWQSPNFKKHHEKKKKKEIEEYKNKRIMFIKLTPNSTALAQNQKLQINRMAKNSFLMRPICILRRGVIQHRQSCKNETEDTNEWKKNVKETHLAEE